MYVEMGPVPVLGAFGAAASGQLPAGSRILVPAGTILKVYGYDTEARMPEVPVALDADVEATAGDLVAVAGDEVIGRDLVSVGGHVVLDADLQVSGAAWEAGARGLKNAGGQVDVFVPRGTEVTILAVGSGQVVPLPLPGGEEVAGQLLPAAQMNEIWKSRMRKAGLVAGTIALVGSAATAALVIKKRHGWAAGVGIVSGLGTLTAIGVSRFAKNKIQA